MLAGLLLAPLACRSGESVPDFSAYSDTLPVYPGAQLVRQGVGPAGIKDATSSRYRYDQTYFVSANATQDDILGAMTNLLQGAGWRIEAAPKSNNKDLQPYLSSGAYKSVSFVKNHVRVLVLAPLPLHLNPAAGGGSQYFVHFEKE